MVKSTAKLTSRTYLFIIAGLAFFAVYLYFFVDIPKMLVLMSQTDLFFYGLAAASTVGGVTLSAITWQLLLRTLNIKLPFMKPFSFVWIGVFIDLIVPAEAVSGDVTKIYFMTKDSKEDPGKIAASVMGSRILSMVVTLVGLTIGSIFLLFRYSLPQFVLVFLSVVIGYSAASIVLLVYMSLRENVTWRVVNWLINFAEKIFRHRWDLSGVRTIAKRLFEAFHEGVQLLMRHPKKLILPIWASGLAWLLDVFIVMFVFYALRFEISFLKVLIVYSLTLSIQAIPLGVPAEIGLTEIVMTSLFAALGITLDVAAAATVLTRILTVWFRIGIGYIFVQWVGIKTLRGNTNPNSN